MPTDHDIVLVRHGQTEWSVNGRHTGRTDLPLTDEGRAQAAELCGRLGEWTFALVLESPYERARETAQLCGLADQAVVDDDLHELDYGDYEGRTTVDIRKDNPGWTVWTATCPNGETLDDAGARADRVIARAAAADGPVALFSHGHFLRILTARWLGLPAVDGKLFALHTGTLCVLSFEHEYHVIDRWNA